MPAADPPPTSKPAPAAANANSSANEIFLPDEIAEIIDVSTFDQIREMDDEGSDEFSRAIVEGFREQAKETFDKMDQSLGKKDLEQLASLGHFLKGSSATLGLVKVKDYCEKIQHYGGNKDETGTVDIPDDGKCLDAIRNALQDMKKEYKKAEKYLLQLYPEEQ
ncbi:histidine-phosphotransfer domain, HPT domain-containing protein [Wilcoxina mikolae CBS 423.85]|nr:histidine-phosphotransfer domain, HPT domain-containing protein [Wilcoxina mikolae CBS 423.85]